MEHAEHREEFDDISEHPHGFDTSEPKGAFIAIFGISVVITLVATILGIQFYYDRVNEEQVYNQVLAPESDQLRNLRAKEDSQLYSYQYIDRERGTVRLSIDRAMDLLAKEAAENRLPYPITPTPVKTAEQLAAGGATAPAVPGANPQGATTTNATPPPPAK